MKQTNYQLVDFLDFADDFQGSDRLWRAGRPVDIRIERGDALFAIPFQKFLPGNDLKPDTSADQVIHILRLRAYANQTLRLSMGLGTTVPESSEMLAFAPEVQPVPLQVVREATAWKVLFPNGDTAAVVNLAEPAIDPWSDLLPPPLDACDVTFFPDGQTPVALNPYDHFFPARFDAFALAYVEREGQPHRVTYALTAAPDEIFAGTGERFAKLDLSGRTLQLKNQDGQGVNNRRTYKNIPFYLSSRGYGLFAHTSAFTKFSLADHSNRSAQILVEDPVLDVFLIGGASPERILYHYRQLTGFPSLPPLWSYGIWMSRMTYFSADEVTDICQRLRDEAFPCDVIHLDTGWFKTDWLCEWKFNPERFPDPAAFMAQLKAQGYRVSLWQMPYISAKAEQHDEAVAHRYIGPIEKAAQQGGSNFSSLDYAGTIDFTYPPAVAWYQDLLRVLLKLGAVCIKTDFGEEIHMDATYHSMTSAQLNNLYALLYQKAAYEVTKEVTGDGIIWARAGWAGCQRYPLHWGGDAACTWEGLASSLKGGLHLGLSGFAYWSHDVPGFHSVPNFMNSVVPDDLYLRWTQFGVFTSHIRYHGTSKREPYHYPKIADAIRRWWNLRYAIIPYILEQSQQVAHNGMPLIRALLLEHPDDPVCWQIDDQYYFGDAFLVAPIQNATGCRRVYLPEGDWVDFFTGEILTGPRWLRLENVPLEHMPVWVKRGSVLPLYPETVSCTDEMDLTKVRPLVIDDTFRGYSL